MFIENAFQERAFVSLCFWPVFQTDSAFSQKCFLPEWRGIANLSLYCCVLFLSPPVHMHGGLLCVASRLSVRLSARLSVWY